MIIFFGGCKQKWIKTIFIYHIQSNTLTISNITLPAARFNSVIIYYNKYHTELLIYGWIKQQYTTESMPQTTIASIAQYYLLQNVILFAHQQQWLINLEQLLIT